MKSTKIKAGTRGSALAIIQTELVTNALLGLKSGYEFENVIIETKGDKNLAPIPLDTVGKAWFTSEIDQALGSRKIDLAVHSLKDLPIALSPDLAMITPLERADARDALISRSGKDLDNLAPGSIIGTDSTRRRSLILHRRPDLTVKSLRGNVQTRLRKLQEEDYDAIVLAAAGLIRLDQQDIITEYLDPVLFTPSIGQGVLAVEVRSSDTDLRASLESIVHMPTVIVAATERSFSEAIGGGCKLPIGCYAELDGEIIRIHGMIGELNGPGIIFKSASGPATSGVELARTLARTMLKSCTFEFKPDPHSQNA